MEFNTEYSPKILGKNVRYNIRVEVLYFYMIWRLNYALIPGEYFKTFLMEMWVY